MVSQSLFDNRYRYDHIYPRGRSGESLRAFDTQDQERPVVIKRPAPQDAPPMRAAQEVSILTEKRALERVSGHSVLAELRGNGSFRVGGSSYHYIVIDRAEGDIVEQLVFDLAAQDQTLPELELLVIVDKLLDLLAHAHSQHVVYNDVDAKHLFWSRENYRLKVIDWGNAVFTDDASTPANITPANDIYQVGELLYFLYHGGARLASETAPDGEYTVIFGENVPEPIQDVITRATHPNVKNRRFASIRSLRDTLNLYRQPIERTRDLQVQDVRLKLVENASQTTLEMLETTISETLLLDPGFPEARRLRNEIRQRLKQLAVQADFEATRIYLETGNWSRAIRLMEELIPNADPYMANVLAFLVAAAEELQNSKQAALPEDFEQVMAALLEKRAQQALDLLIDDRYRDIRLERWLMAERLIVLLPQVTPLLPAHLMRLSHELQPHDPMLAEEIEKITLRLNSSLESGIAPLLDRYSRLAIQLNDLYSDLEKFTLTASAEHAESTARQVIQNLRRVAETFYTSPETAQNAFEQAKRIDPESRVLAALPDYLAEVRAVVENLGTFRPTRDSAALEAWFEEAQTALEPYSDITDPAFLSIGHMLAETLQNWFLVGDMLTMGRQRPAMEKLRKMSAAVRPYNPYVAIWFDNTTRLVQEGTVIERFSPNQALGELLVEGYNAWDQGQSGRAAETARRALPLAKTPGEEAAVERLARLAEITNNWLNGGQVKNNDLTDETEHAALELFLDDEAAEFERFTQQMKNEDVYLKAMKLGIVAHMKGSSSVGYRALFVHYVLRGVMTVQEDKLADADFWRQAALNTHHNGQTHPLFSAFDTALTQRKLVLNAEEALNSLQSFNDIYAVKQAINAPLADDWLKDAQQAINALETTMGHWADGDFRSARDAFNKALDSLELAEKNGNMKLDNLRQWILPYRDRAVELMERRQIVEQAAMAGSLKPDGAVLRALEQIVDISEATVGAETSRQVRLWRDLYKTMVRTHQNVNHSKREKIAEFDINFAALFIEKHPAYRLFQRWYEAARALPDDVREDIQISVGTMEEVDTTTESPRYTETEAEEEEAPYLEETPDPYAEDNRPARSWNWVIIVAGIVLLGFGAFAAMQLLNREDKPPITRFAATPTQRDGAVSAVNDTAMPQSPTATFITNTPARTFSLPTTEVPIIVNIDIPPSTTPDIPTIAPTLTPTEEVIFVTNTPPATFTDMPPPTEIGQAPDIGDDIDVLRILSLIQPADYDWDERFFSQGAGGAWSLGASTEEVGSAPIAIVISPDFMEAFNPETGLRLRGATATMQLTFYDQDRVENEQVFFGLGLQNARRQRYAAQVQLLPDGVVSLGVNENGRFRARSQIPMSRIEVTLSLQRNDDGTISFFVDGQRVGDAPNLFPLDEPVNLVLYNAGGGMSVAVSELILELAPYTP